MDKIVQTIQSLSTKEEEIRQLRSLLKQSEDVIAKQLPNLDASLGALNPTQHALGYLWILDVQAQHNGGTNVSTFLRNASALMIGGPTSQLRNEPDKVSRVARVFTEQAIKTMPAHRLVACIRPLKAAVVKIRPSPECLVPPHADLMKIVLLSKAYNQVDDILAQVILDVDKPRSGIVPRDLMLYFYYAGTVHIGLKQYRAAIDKLFLCFTTPANVVSAIMVAALKRYMLVSLIEDGAVAGLPRHVNNIQRHLKQLVSPYADIVGVYARHRSEDLAKVVAKYEAQLRDDDNLGLAKQVVASMYRRNILRLTKTYLTLSLADIAKQVGLKDAAAAEAQLLRMIEDKVIFASINQRDGMVQFLEDPEQFNSAAVMSSMHETINAAMSTSTRITALNETITSSPLYIQKTQLHGGDRNRFPDGDDMLDMDRSGGAGASGLASAGPSGAMGRIFGLGRS